MGLCLSHAMCHHDEQEEAAEECKPELASGRFDSFSKSMSTSFSFMRDAPRYSNLSENGDYSILAKSQTTGTTTIQDIRIALEKLSASHVVPNSKSQQGKISMSGDNTPSSRMLFPPLILHLSNVLAAKKIAAIETGKGDSELGIPPNLKSLRSKSMHDQTTLSSSFRSISFADVSRGSRHTQLASESWEAMSNDWFKSFEKQQEKSAS